MPKVTFNSITQVRYMGSTMDYFGTLKEPCDPVPHGDNLSVRWARAGDIILSRNQSHGYGHTKIVKILAKYKNHEQRKVKSRKMA